MKFFRTLNSRVNNYFKETIFKKGNWALFKNDYSSNRFFRSYFYFNSWHAFLGTSFTDYSHGIGMAGVGMNVMHDGNHGSYSNKSWVNKFMELPFTSWRKCTQLASTTQCTSYLYKYSRSR
jgi:linoleoyl-CoA desaturase